MCWKIIDGSQNPENVRSYFYIYLNITMQEYISPGGFRVKKWSA